MSSMNWQQVIQTKIELPDSTCTDLIKKSKDMRVLNALDVDRLKQLATEPGEVLIYNERCYSIALNTAHQWILVQLDDQTSAEYRLQYLIQNTNSHHTSLTIH
jgi:hypothetical protein